MWTAASPFRTTKNHLGGYTQVTPLVATGNTLGGYTQVTPLVATGNTSDDSNTDHTHTQNISNHQCTGQQTHTACTAGSITNL